MGEEQGTQEPEAAPAGTGAESLRVQRIQRAEQLRATGCFFSPSRQCYTSPSITTFHNILAKLPPDSFDECLQAWADQLQKEHERKESKRKEA